MAKTFPNTGDALALAAAAAAARFKPRPAPPVAAPAAPVVAVPAAPAAVEPPALPEAAPAPAPSSTKGPVRRSKGTQQPPKPQPKVQFNIVLPPGHRERLRAAAFAYGTTERELIERFIEQLPDVEVQAPEPPRGMAWMRPR